MFSTRPAAQGQGCDMGTAAPSRGKSESGPTCQKNPHRQEPGTLGTSESLPLLFVSSSMLILPDEILSEILSPALKMSDALFSDTSSVSPSAEYSPSTSAYLLGQAKALKIVLRANPAFGRFIRKLRVEGGTESSCTPFSSPPQTSPIYFSPWKFGPQTSPEGCVKGLPLINPRRVIVVDAQHVDKPPSNKHLTALLEVLFDCLEIWGNLVFLSFIARPKLLLNVVQSVVGFPYSYKYSYGVPRRAWGHWSQRALDLAYALTGSQTVHTVILSEIYTRPDFFSELLEIPVFLLPRKRTKPFLPNPPDPKAAPSYPSFHRPSFIASEEIRELVWKRVLFLAIPRQIHPLHLPPPATLPAVKELSNHFQELADTTISTPAFAHFTELRVLELSSDHSVKFTSDCTLENAMPKLHTLSLEFRLTSTNPPLSNPSSYRAAATCLPTKLLNVHKDHRLHLSIGYVETEDVAFDMCKLLVVFEVRSSFDMTDLKSTTPHESLAAIFVWDLVGYVSAADGRRPKSRFSDRNLFGICQLSALPHPAHQRSSGKLEVSDKRGLHCVVGFQRAQPKVKCPNMGCNMW
ncbi:hypothetical protein DFH09DRAFT_1466206 [Mycena vulgaris]|nr:hypothetical protein DFH09DRAFT_1466206 [Mycena vulgaris]